MRESFIKSTTKETERSLRFTKHKKTFRYIKNIIQYRVLAVFFVIFVTTVQNKSFRSPHDNVFIFPHTYVCSFYFLYGVPKSSIYWVFNLEEVIVDHNFIKKIIQQNNILEKKSVFLAKDL